MWNHRIVWSMIMLGLLFLASGCAEKQVEGETITTYYDLNSRLLSVGVALGAIGYSVFRFRQNNILQGVIGAVGAVAALVFFVPAMFGEYAVMTPSELKLQRVGVFAGKSIDLKFDDVRAARLTLTTSRGRRGRQNKSYFLECDLKSGQNEKIPLGELLEPMFAEIATGLGSRGVEIVNLTGE